MIGGISLLPLAVQGQSLRGSTASLDRQERAAQIHDFTYIASPGEVERFVKAGYLVQVRAKRGFRPERGILSFPSSGNPDLHSSACQSVSGGLWGETGGNQHDPAPFSTARKCIRPAPFIPPGWPSTYGGVTARPVDLGWRVLFSHSRGPGCWRPLANSYPPHYHIALFPEPYARYVDDLSNQPAETRVASADVVAYRVRRGDSLWDIAKSHGTSVDRLKQENDLKGSRIYAGQLLQVPVTR